MRTRCAVGQDPLEGDDVVELQVARPAATRDPELERRGVLGADDPADGRPPTGPASRPPVTAARSSFTDRDGIFLFGRAERASAQGL